MAIVSIPQLAKRLAGLMIRAGRRIFRYIRLFFWGGPYPNAELVTLVCDNLNTHDIASLYATFDAETAHRLTQRLRIIHTPRNGSWLNMAEMELSILSRVCASRSSVFLSLLDDSTECLVQAWHSG